MSVLYAATLQAFKSRGWHYREVSGREVLEADFEAHHGKVLLHTQVFGDAGMVSVVSRASFPFQATHRAKVAELLMLTNHHFTQIPQLSSLDPLTDLWPLIQFFYYLTTPTITQRPTNRPANGLKQNMTACDQIEIPGT